MTPGLSRNEYYQLLGLLTLAERHNARLSEIEDAVHELLEIGEDEEPAAGHVFDALFNGSTLDELIERLNLAVEPSS